MMGRGAKHWSRAVKRGEMVEVGRKVGRVRESAGGLEKKRMW
jgi:hypothetical protein